MQFLWWEEWAAPLTPVLPAHPRMRVTWEQAQVPTGRLIRVNGDTELVTLPVKLIDQIDYLHRLFGSHYESIPLDGDAVLWVRENHEDVYPIHEFNGYASWIAPDGLQVRGSALLTGWDEGEQKIVDVGNGRVPPPRMAQPRKAAR